MQGDDLRQLMLSCDMQGNEQGLIDKFLAEENYQEAFTVLCRHGDEENSIVVACLGVAFIWAGRGEAWMVLSDDADRWDMRYLTRVSLKILPQIARRLHLRRMEATALVGWKPGEQWAKILGFSLVALLEQYDPCGRDHWSFVKIWDQQESQSQRSEASLVAFPPSNKAERNPKPLVSLGV